jgi:hypothetical protein
MSSRTPPSTDKEVIANIGDEALIKAGYTEWQIKKWGQKTRGIPWKDRAKVAQIAAAKRVKVPADFLQERRKAAEQAA